ncbi:lipase [Embleya scabrispora]|uniref:Lipase n=1 Tax=Embleya scabrispora TaxID=159449 RepID=A0A1T3NQ72_9ACTN|nr:SGNH/GDSL hydrolase family protein [Embleya scabrispora]OPC79053.1 lipase [Embleya scabrispora]
MPSLARVTAPLAAAGLVLTGLAAPTAHSAPAAPTSSYAALGDSYSSGVGAGDYLPGGGDCKRSANAYPSLWHRAHPAAEFAFAACSGATTAQVLGGQTSVLSAGTTLVTISVGGNDVGFADTIRTCVLGTDRDCADAVATSRAYTRDRLPADLDATYARIRLLAPRARLVVLGYPRLFELGGCLFGLSEAKRRVLDEAADMLDETTAGRAAAAGADFADVRDRFAGHGVCGADEWLHGVTLPLDESYHPTATGQAKGYLPGLVAVAG